MLETTLYCAAAVFAVIAIKRLFGGVGGGIVFRGTDKYNRYQSDAEARARDILKNGTGSTKAELQEWWDTYHK